MKLTTWNIEHLKTPISNPTKPIYKERLKYISDEIRLIDPDILCIIEAPGDLVGLQKWIDLPKNQGGLDGAYKIPTIAGTDDILVTNPPNVRKALQGLYDMYGTDITGNQWIWFLIKKDVYDAISNEMQDPKVWQGMTGRKNWPVHYWGNYKSKMTKHWRHPQTLVLKLGGKIVEIIGVHLKSKINRKSAFDQQKNLKQEYVEEALRARIKLATEAYNVRKYIDQRFQQESDPRIIVCGDMNDGGGREFFERQYLFFDLISNIQGGMFLADRFLNHALFDYDEHLRWSTEFNDRIERWAIEKYGLYNHSSPVFDNTKKQLIDHILFTQAFVNGSGGPKIASNSGFVEHTIHEKMNAGLSSTKKTSDHRPVSLEIQV